MATIYARVTGRNPSDERSGIDGEKWELLALLAITLLATGVRALRVSRIDAARTLRDE